MPAGPFERSMGLGDAWGGVADVWLEPHEGADEPHAGVARRRGAPRGARDSRGRAWRHLGIWRHGTIVRCAVPRADCPGHGARTVRTPWEARPNSHLAATDGRDRGAPARPCAQLEAHGGDAPATPEVARDMAAPCSLGCAGARPNASQAVDRLPRGEPDIGDPPRRRRAPSTSRRARPASPPGRPCRHLPSGGPACRYRTARGTRPNQARGVLATISVEEPIIRPCGNNSQFESPKVDFERSKPS